MSNPGQTPAERAAELFASMLDAAGRLPTPRGYLRASTPERARTIYRLQLESELETCQRLGAGYEMHAELARLQLDRLKGDDT